MNCESCGDVDGNGQIEIWDAALVKIWSVNPGSEYVDILGIGEQDCGYTSTEISRLDDQVFREDDLVYGVSLFPQAASVGDTLYLTNYVSNLEEHIYGYTVRIPWDESKLRFIDIAEDNFLEFWNFDSIDYGILKAAWSNHNPIVTDTSLFTIQFETLSDDIIQICPEVLGIGPTNLASSLTVACADRPAVSISRMQHEIPSEFTLLPCYPNPFNPETNLRYGLNRNSAVEISIFDVLGREVKTWHFDSQTPGWYQLTWDGKSDNNVQISSGVFFCKVVANDSFAIIKLMYLK